MRQENIHRVVLNLSDIRKAKIGQGLRLEIPTGTTEIIIKVEGSLNGNGNGNGYEQGSAVEASTQKN